MKIEKTKEEMQEFYKKHQKENQEESLNKVQYEKEIQRKEDEKKQKEIELKKEKQVRVSNEFTNIAKQLLLKFIDLDLYKITIHESKKKRDAFIKKRNKKANHKPKKFKKK